jgi:hypothetical protein
MIDPAFLQRAGQGFFLVRLPARHENDSFLADCFTGWVGAPSELWQNGTLHA